MFNPFYPLTLLVTFLHEFSHALAALLTGGQVLSLQVNTDGSGLCTTAGGSIAIVSAAGYLGSILLGNMLLRIGWKSPKFSPYFVMLLSICMLLVSLFWFGGWTSFLITVAMGVAIAWLSWKFSRFARAFLILSGVYSVLYIVRDYDVGPSSDLAVFAQATFLPAGFWMWVWLAFAVVVSFFNIRSMLKSKS